MTPSYTSAEDVGSAPTQSERAVWSLDSADGGVEEFEISGGTSFDWFDGSGVGVGTCNWDVVSPAPVSVDVAHGVAPRIAFTMDNVLRTSAVCGVNELASGDDIVAVESLLVASRAVRREEPIVGGLAVCFPDVDMRTDDRTGEEPPR